jgi:hypothetical protein
MLTSSGMPTKHYRTQMCFRTLARVYKAGTSIDNIIRFDRICSVISKPSNSNVKDFLSDVFDACSATDDYHDSVDERNKKLDESKATDYRSRH